MLKNCSFSRIFSTSMSHPALPIKIVNPHTGKFYQTYALIDTGADECALPASIASIIGHNLTQGTAKYIGTGNGTTASYSHTTTLEIFNPDTNLLTFTVNDMPVDYMPNLNIALIGVRNFLSNYKLHLDYPAQKFSIF